MRQWDEAIPALKEAMTQHFPDSSCDEIERWADKIYNSNSSAASLERLERGDKRPVDDIENIVTAANNLRLASHGL